MGEGGGMSGGDTILHFSGLLNPGRLHTCFPCVTIFNMLHLDLARGTQEKVEPRLEVNIRWHLQNKTRGITQTSQKPDLHPSAHPQHLTSGTSSALCIFFPNF